MARLKKIKSPTQLDLVEPLFAVLVELGGSATIDEIRDNIINKLKLSDDVVDEPHKGNASQQTELEYQLAWARTRLKNLGAIVNSKRGVWMITPEYAGRKSITREEVTENIKVTKLKAKPRRRSIRFSKTEIPPMTVSIPSRIRNLGERNWRKPCTT